MCGLAGFWELPPSAGEALHVMASSLSHRGPHAAGHW
jgi:asparagine synthetase B (glutamine-hydrolysing)